MGEGRQKGGRCRCGGAPTCNVTPLRGGGGFQMLTVDYGGGGGGGGGGRLSRNQNFNFYPNTNLIFLNLIHFPNEF